MGWALYLSRCLLNTTSPEYLSGWIKADTYLNIEAFNGTLRVPQEK